MKRGGFLAAAISVAALWATGASALVELQLRGGWADSVEEFPYAREFPEGPAIFGIYGDGLFGEADVSVDLLGFGIEVGADDAQLYGDNSTGGALDNDCKVDPVLGLLDACFDRITADTYTRILTGDVLLTKKFALIPGLRLAFGATGLFLDSEIDSENIFIGGVENSLRRDTSLDAYGVKAGLEHSLPIINTGLSLNAELYGSWVWGERTVEIFDVQTDDGTPEDVAAVLFAEDVDVPVLDAAVSLSYRLSSVASVEVGGKYRRVYGAMFTADTIEPGSGIGGDAEDLDYWAVFGGLILGF